MSTYDTHVYERVTGIEMVEAYKPGGFHPIEVGDRLNERYVVVDKLGQGGYSTIWIARDETLSKYVAVKVCAAHQTTDERDILRRLSERAADTAGGRLVVPILDHFSLTGPNGTHSCIATPPARCSVHQSRIKAPSWIFPARVGTALAAQLIMATDYVHKAGIVHGDIHLGNALLQLPSAEIDGLSTTELYAKYYPPEPHPVQRVDEQPETSPSVPKNIYMANMLGKPGNQVPLAEAQLWLTDFGTAFDPAQETRLLSFTRMESRPPETIFAPTTPLTFSSDIWGLGLMVWEVMGYSPFLGFDNWGQDVVIAGLIDALGPLPPPWYDSWAARAQWFTDDGRPTEGRICWPFERMYEHMICRPRRNQNQPQMDSDERSAFVAMIQGMLRFRPEERWTSAQVMQCEWMTKWGLPTAEEALQSVDVSTGQ